MKKIPIIKIRMGGKCKGAGAPWGNTKAVKDVERRRGFPLKGADELSPLLKTVYAT